MVESREYRVWDRTVRVFHWLNFICVVSLIFLGTALLYTGELGLSLEGNVRLKTLHVLIGYVFALNLAWRLVWGFTGGHYARWRQVLPFGRGYAAELKSYVLELAQRNAPVYLGHNPLGRIAVSVMLLVLLVLAVSGLVITGTDLYMPPFGHSIAVHIAAPGLAPWQVRPHVPDAASAQQHAAMMATVDPRAYAAMVARLRKPFEFAHRWGYYVLLLLIAAHITAVIMAEVGSDSGIVSAMFSGKKSVNRRAADLPVRSDDLPLQRRACLVQRVTRKTGEPK